MAQPQPPPHQMPPMQPINPMSPAHPQHPHHAQYLQKQQTAAKLVMLSHIFGWGGVGFLLVLGPGLAMAVNGTLGAVLMGLGLIGAVVGAVLGQVGRGLQGRVI